MNEFEAFYRRNLRLVHALALTRDAAQPDQAEDLTQETFYRAWRHFDRLNSLEPIAQRAWLARTVGNLSIDGWRRGRTIPLQEEPHLSAVSEPGEPNALRLDVAQALSFLEEVDREMVVLRYFAQMNSREIGDVLGMPEGTVRSRLLGCRKRLAGLLAAWNPEGGQW